MVPRHIINIIYPSIFLNLFVHIISSSNNFLHVAYMIVWCDNVDYGAEIYITSDLLKQAEY